MNESLIYISSHDILEYVTSHPIDWGDREVSRIGARGDVMPPTLVMKEFLSCLKKKQALFSQEEFREYCQQIPEWGPWWKKLSPDQRKGFLYGKINGNFYPAAIDQIYIWALLVEAKWFDSCIIDSLRDGVGKHDLILSKHGHPPIAIDVYVATQAAINARLYKQKFRKAPSGETFLTYDVPIPMGRPRRPGNKRWPCLKDLETVYAEYCLRNTLWDTPIVPCTCGHHVGRRSA